ncbi:hypothetical protein D3875_15035 [Deinococcus cavernae]|uniref:Peptidase M14 domain-containing protein n=1 Tax=Deinococcus cavernae TaxID=2320857 RepID=A0A418V9A2_9DEIO|nr:M14 family zinc carboxypeptidase [Deinococcus cavernae]RJF72659.1 hypothetical protein D3875_15035 [Deinococcus cavernae]
MKPEAGGLAADLKGWSWRGPTDQARVQALLSAQGVTDPRQLDVWVSLGRQGRAALQTALQERFPGSVVHVMSCYKPLVCALRPRVEGWQAQPPRHLHLRYPVLPDAHPERFLLEAYPLAGWAAQLGSRFTAEPTLDTLPEDALPEYLLDVDGEVMRVAVPVRQGHAVTGEAIQRMTGRIRVDGTLTLDFPTAFEALWDAYHAWLEAQVWPDTAPFFDVLRVTARLPAEREELAYDHEALDLTEVLAEELYFGTQEFFQRRAGVEAGSRTLQMGQIIPLVQLSTQEVGLEVHSGSAAALAPEQPTARLPDLQRLDRPPTPAEARHWLGTSPAGTVAARSVRGRPVWSFGAGQGGLLVTGGQHANESTGVVAALRAVQELGLQERAVLPDAVPLTVIPLENPDGYALFDWLCREQHPAHMHHAARYTALGDDLEYRPHPHHERAGRVAALAGEPRLHVNLHGYPAHEWARPLAGYVPRGFEAWTLPKGFCLIFRHRPDQEARAGALASFITGELARQPDLMALNARQLAVYEAHTSLRPYRVIHGTPCLFTAHDTLDGPLVLLTEYPDETVTGPAFLLGQRAQFAVIQAALAWLERSSG